MDSLKFKGVVEVLLNRMRDCQLISPDEFDKCVEHNFDTLDRKELEMLIVDLFHEHTRLTSLINDVSDLSTAYRKFSFLFE